LTQAVLDSNRLKADSLTTLVWPDGKPFDVSKSSVIVPVFRYLMDSTQKESETFLANELQFDTKTDLLNETNEQVFKSLAAGLYKFKEVQVKVVVNSDKDDRASLKRGFVLKNRLVGEGVSPARIEVKSTDPSVTFSSGESAVYLVLSKGRY
jgi:outer membrane protein OmpA-like peptidoglycan-associated protein